MMEKTSDEMLDQQEPFTGLLLVFNMGEENYSSLMTPPEFEEEVIEAIADAHANGRAVIYVFDGEIDPSNPPEDFDYIEDSDCFYVTKVGGTDFELMPEVRVEQFAAIAKKAIKTNNIVIDSDREHHKAIGWAKITGIPTFFRQNF